MKNFVDSGDTLVFTASGDVASGEGVLVGALFGVAAGDVADAEEGVAHLVGSYELPKATSQSWNLGVRLYWSDANSNVTTTATGNTLIGAAAAAAASSDTSGVVRLNGVA